MITWPEKDHVSEERSEGFGKKEEQMHSFIFFSPPPFLSFPYFPSLISSFIYYFLLLITGSFSTPFLFLLSSFSDDLTFTQYCLNFATVVYTEVAQTVI